MSIGPDPFHDVKRLLKWKRHEQPPPGYFQNFSSQVIRQLERQDPVEYSSLWEWLVRRFDAKPFLVGAYSLALSCLLLAGFKISVMFENERTAVPIPSVPWLAASSSPDTLFPLTDQEGVAETAPSISYSLTKPDPAHLLFRSEALPAQRTGFLAP